jgi:GAF domain-containing protein
MAAFSRWTGDEPSDATDPEFLATVVDLVAAVRDHASVDEALRCIGDLAVRSVQAADAAGLTVLLDGRPAPAADTAPLAADADALQVGLAEGPGWAAIADRRTVVVDAVATDDRWPAFGPDAAALGVGSVLTLPLLTAGEIGGNLTLYARAEHAFSPSAVAAGERFARPAAMAVSQALLLEGTRTLADAVHDVLGVRVDVDVAVGILIYRSAVDEDEAVEHLGTIATTLQSSVPDVARRIVTDAPVWRNSRPRHDDDGGPDTSPADGTDPERPVGADAA